MKLLKNKILLMPSLVKVLMFAAIFFSILLPFNGNAQTVYIGGTLTADKVLSKDTTYIVYQDIIVPQNIKLIIEPGATVKVIQSRGIYVDGILRAGSLTSPQADSICFLSNMQKGNLVWRWKGIVFRNNTQQDSSFLIKTSIKDADIAVEINESENILIKNSKRLTAKITVGLFGLNIAPFKTILCI